MLGSARIVPLALMPMLQQVSACRVRLSALTVMPLIIALVAIKVIISTTTLAFQIYPSAW